MWCYDLTVNVSELNLLIIYLEISERREHVGYWEISVIFHFEVKKEDSFGFIPITDLVQGITHRIVGTTLEVSILLVKGSTYGQSAC